MYDFFRANSVEYVEKKRITAIIENIEEEEERGRNQDLSETAETTLDFRYELMSSNGSITYRLE